MELRVAFVTVSEAVPVIAPDSRAILAQEIRIEGFAESRVHAARSSRRRIFFRLVSGDVSPS